MSLPRVTRAVPDFYRGDTSESGDLLILGQLEDAGIERPAAVDEPTVRIEAAP